MRRYANRPDDNQHDIDLAFESIGAVVISMRGDPSIGFDDLVAYRGRLFVIEVKDGNKTPSHQKLTKNEKTRRAQLAGVGVEYHVVRCISEAIEVVTQ